MNKGAFIHRVQALTGITDRNAAERATSVVLETLCGRITHDEAQDLEAQLPEGIDTMCRGSVLKDMVSKVKGPDRLDREAFIEKIAHRAKLQNVQAAEQVTSAVFKIVKEQITEGEAQDVADQLPKRLKIMWLES